jgi:hypothetical protein
MPRLFGYYLPDSAKLVWSEWNPRTSGILSPDPTRNATRRFAASGCQDWHAGDKRANGNGGKLSKGDFIPSTKALGGIGSRYDFDFWAQTH